MAEIQQNHGFQPSREALMKWLGTRKLARTRGKVTLPGLFQTYNYQKDASAFVLVILLEILGLFALIVAWKRLDAVAVGVVVAFFLIDLFCAWRLHKNHGRFTLVANKKILNNEDAKEVSILEASLSSEKIIINICKLAIIIIAMMKIYAFTVLSYKINGITLAVILIYALIAMIHIYNTGYFLAERRTISSIKSDFSAFLGKNANSSSIELNAVSHYVFINNMLLKEHRVNQHTLTKINKEDEQLAYQFQSTGVLTDDELDLFVTVQIDRETKSMVAEKGLELQLQILGEN
jgi:hypothetical protein